MKLTKPSISTNWIWIRIGITQLGPDNAIVSPQPDTTGEDCKYSPSLSLSFSELNLYLSIHLFTSSVSLLFELIAASEQAKQQDVLKSKLLFGEFVILSQNYTNSSSQKELLAERIVKLVSTTSHLWDTYGNTEIKHQTDPKHSSLSLFFSLYLFRWNKCFLPPMSERFTLEWRSQTYGK